ncbi:MAG: HAD-IIB family hydrolase [Clostridiaceae bacterium]
MTKIRLCALDVDGTLINSDLEITQAVGRAVDALEQSGVVPAIVTGRTVKELEVLRARFPSLRYFIVSNGAYAFDAANGECFYRNLLPLELAKSVVAKAQKYPVMIEVYADGASHVDAAAWANKAAYRLAFLSHPSLGPARIPTEDVGAFLAGRASDIEKLYISFAHLPDLETLKAFCEALPVDLVVSIHDGLEVNQRGVEKGAGLQALSGRLDILQEETAAIGDGFADIPILRFAGLPIAMGHAAEEVKSVAALISPDNDHDGAAWAIQQVLAAR